MMIDQRTKSVSSRFRRLRVAITSLAVFGLAGCSIADGFGPRAIAYNVEANNARTNASLLNVVRAAYRLPLQFTDVSSVVGSATASGSLSANIPIIGDGTTLSPMAGLSGGPNFTVSSLNTQEFYNGIQTPISVQIIGNLVDQGVRPEILFPLVLSSVIIDDGRQLSIINLDISTKSQFEYTYSYIGQLIRSGLFVAKPSATAQVGPDLSPNEARMLLPDVVRASADARSGNTLPDLTAELGGKKYSLRTDTSRYVFCFDSVRKSKLEKDTRYDLDSNLSFARRNTKLKAPLVYANGQPAKQFAIPSSLTCQNPNLGSKDGFPKITFGIRSVQGIYAYLGALVRISLGLNGQPPAEPAFPPPNPGLEPDFFLFRINVGAPGSIDPAVDFGGSTYFVSADPTGYDGSGEVMQILAILQALNSKATALPSPGVAILAR